MARDVLAPPLRGLALGDAVLEMVAFEDAHDQSSIMTTCGTRGCIAGWALAIGMPLELATGIVRIGEAYRLAPRLLGLDSEEFKVLVYDEMDDAAAIENFRALLDARYSQPQTVSFDDVVQALTS